MSRAAPLPARRRDRRPAAARDPFAARRSAIERHLERTLSTHCRAPRRLFDAMRYAVLSPGKRVRPLFTLAACEAVCGSWRPALPAAAAVECVHAFSLVHDDLPAMDDDDLRRGMPTTHRRFDEATAILAGDALLSFAFEELARLTLVGVPAARALQAVRLLAVASGAEELVGGQHLDLAAEGREAGEREVYEIHRRKTGALFGAAMAIGGLAGGTGAERVSALESAGRQLGLAFQIQDDLLDAESSLERLGKRPGADAAHGKATYPGAVGAERARVMAASHLDLTWFILEEYRLATPHLGKLIAAMGNRSS